MVKLQLETSSYSCELLSVAFVERAVTILGLSSLWYRCYKQRTQFHPALFSHG